MEWKIFLDKNSDTPLYRQLGHAIAAMISQGELMPDTRLPPIRQLAKILGVNSTTVVNAYKYLEHKQAVYSVVGSGTYVARACALPGPTAVEVHGVLGDDYINFADGAVDGALFPTAAMKRAFGAVLDRDGALAFECCGGLGYGPLRESLSRLYGSFDAGQICIISGVQHGLDILAGILLKPGDTVLVERPAPQSIAAIFQAKGARVMEMPLVQHGPDFPRLEALLKKRRPRLIYVMPNFQQPTGICYSDESKTRLLALACAHGAYIVEDDSLGDLYYDRNKRTPLKAMDSHGRVVHMKSFARTVPGVNIGFMAYPGQIGVGDDVGFIDCPGQMEADDAAVPGYLQRAFDIFLRSGDYDAHIANVRNVYKRRYQKAAAAVNTYLAGLADVYLPGGGLGLWVTPRAGSTGGKDYVEEFLKRKVIVSPERLYIAAGSKIPAAGTKMPAAGAKVPGFRINFASVPEERIAEGIGVIAAVLGHNRTK